MKREELVPRRASRRAFLTSLLAAGTAPWFVPARVLGAAGQTPPSDKITLGVIGVGAQGQGDMQNFLSSDRVRVTAICDVNQRNIDSARKRIAEAYGNPDVKVFADFRELNADPAIDAVLMALPVHWHSIPAMDAVLHGKHIYHEKPMGMSFEESRHVRAAVRKQGVVFQFGTQQRSDMKFRWACELARNGRLGKLKEIHVSVPGGKQGPAFAEQPVPDLRRLGPLGRAGADDAVPRGQAQTRQSREHHQFLAGHDLVLGHPPLGHRPVGQRHGRHRPQHDRRRRAVSQRGWLRCHFALEGAFRARACRARDLCQRWHAGVRARNSVPRRIGLGACQTRHDRGLGRTAPARSAEQGRHDARQAAGEQPPHRQLHRRDQERLACDLPHILRWKVRFEHATAAPVTFVSDGTPGFEHGIRFLGESAWVHVKRGTIAASDEQILRDPQNKVDTMPVKLPVSNHHTDNFIDAIRTGSRAICDIGTAVRSDTLCQLALIAVKQGRQLHWDSQTERFIGDEAANAMLQPRTFRGDWTLPEIEGA